MLALDKLAWSPRRWVADSGHDRVLQHVLVLAGLIGAE